MQHFPPQIEWKAHPQLSGRLADFGSVPGYAYQPHRLAAYSLGVSRAMCQHAKEHSRPKSVHNISGSMFRLHGDESPPLVRLKELFLKTTVLLALASAKRIEDLHSFSVDNDCIRFGPGDCSVTLRPRLEYVPKSLSTPFERTETVSLSALATESSPSQSADARLQFAPLGL